MDDEEHIALTLFFLLHILVLHPLYTYILFFNWTCIAREHSTDLGVCLMQLILSLYITQQVVERLILLTSRSVIRSVLIFGHRNSSVIDLHNVLKLEQIHFSFF